MTDIVIGEKLASKLREAARLKGQTVEEFIEAIVDRTLPAKTTGAVKITAPPGTLAALAQAAEQADIVLLPDLSARSREILDSEFPDYLKSRLSSDPEPDDDNTNR